MMSNLILYDAEDVIMILCNHPSLIVWVRDIKGVN